MELTAVAVTSYRPPAAQAGVSVFSARDKSERAFGVAFVKLMNADGTTLQDGRHDLVVYKVMLTELDVRMSQFTPVP